MIGKYKYTMVIKGNLSADLGVATGPEHFPGLLFPRLLLPNKDIWECGCAPLNIYGHCST